MNSKFLNILQQLKEALARFEEVMREKKNDIIRDSAIQRFEFTFELAWKTIKAYLKEKGAEELYFPRDVIRAAFQAGIIDDDPQWLAMIDTRNLTSHIYNQAMAEQAYAKFSVYLPLIKKLIENLGG
ncbi:MAG: nucleotidyltransferase substrate binding protein [Candidatus Saganbacteria bacterium]|nr:nucleotidyltransferase substrate binding protein [Candidatus Saganbacteria bacterium]